MAKNNNLTDFLTELADKIRAGGKISGTVNPQDFSKYLSFVSPALIDGKSTFSLTEYDLYNVTAIRNYAFNGCSGMTGITIPDSVTSIGGFAFAGCSGLASITIPNSVTSIGSYAFNGCSGMTGITIPNSVPSIATWVFANCSRLTSVTIGNSVESIENYAFYNCSGLTSVTIPDSVTKIGYNVFYNCTSLQTVYIGSKVTSIGSSALQTGSSSKKTTFTITATTPPAIQSNTFNSSYIYRIYVPTASVSTYKAATNWSSLSSYIYDGGF